MKVSRKTFDEVMMPCYVPQDMVLTQGKGCFVYDSEDNKYLDLTSGIAVNCLGHNHPVVVKTIKKQAKRLIHASNIFVNDKTLTLAKKLTAVAGFDKVFFVNSGAEANEAALKLARRVAYDNYGADKCEIISFAHSFHGRTFFSVSVGGQEKYYQGFGPIPGGITHLPFNDLDAFSHHISDKTCAVIVEVVQGEGGILEVDPDFIHGVRELCTKFNALLIFDEVQTGVGRLGTFYGYEQAGVKPDILTSAKGLAAGVPIGAILTTTQIASHFKPGTHGSTFGGNALACAVGSKVVDIVSKSEFLANVVECGAYLREQLQELNAKYQVFAEIRGKGLLIGAQLASSYSEYASLFQKLCTKNHLLVLLAGHDVIRFAPPLIITKSIIRKAMKLLELAILDFLTDKDILSYKAASSLKATTSKRKPHAHASPAIQPTPEAEAAILDKNQDQPCALTSESQSAPAQISASLPPVAKSQEVAPASTLEPNSHETKDTAAKVPSTAKRKAKQEAISGPDATIASNPALVAESQAVKTKSPKLQDASKAKSKQKSKSVSHKSSKEEKSKAAKSSLADAALSSTESLDAIKGQAKVSDQSEP